MAQAPSGPSTAMGLSAAQSTSLAGLVSGIGAAYASKAEGYLKQAGYAVQAQENLRMSGLRADKEVEYAELQAGRKQFQTQLDQMNYQVQINSMLSNLREVNAAARARGAANGVDIGSGAAYAIQRRNVQDTYRDVGIVNLSALISRVFGMEDATNILRAGYDSAFYEREAALANARTLQSSGQSAVAQGGLLATAQLVQSGIKFAQTFPSQPKTNKTGTG
jgi:hypothetical protein